MCCGMGRAAERGARGQADLVEVVRAGGAGDASTPVAGHVGGTESYQARCRLHRSA
jgi:hypothetical protein